MACLIVPAAAGIVTTVFRKRFPEGLHVEWLNTMFLGATIALGIDHVAGGEIAPYPPFVTAAAAGPEGVSAIMSEIIGVGVPMTFALVLVWFAIVFVHERVFAGSSRAGNAAG